MIWQTDIEDWLPFPWACENMKLEGSTDLPGFYSRDEHNNEGLDMDEIAFYCKRHQDHRILACECLGMSCPDCKLHNHDKFIQMLRPEGSS